MTTDKTYRVLVTREHGSWLADVPDLSGAHTWAKNLPSLDRSVREVIALVEDLPEGAEPDIDIRYTYVTGNHEVDRLTAALRWERERIQREERRLQDQTTAAVGHLLTRMDMSVRDAATLSSLPVRQRRVVVIRRDRSRLSGRADPFAPPE